MPKRPTKLTLSPESRRMGADLVRHFGYDSLTELVDTLLRDHHAHMSDKASGVPRPPATNGKSTVHLSHFSVQKPDNQKPNP